MNKPGLVDEIGCFPRLIVTADDLGLTEGVNRGIITAFQNGIVTSSTLLSVGQGLTDAKARLCDNPELEVGIHFCLDEEVAVSPPREIPTLVGRDGRLLSRGGLISRLLSGRLCRDEVRLELSRQVDRFLELDLLPAHITTHGHIHAFPWIAGIIKEVAEEHHLPRRIRALLPIWTGFYSPKRALLVQLLAANWEISRRVVFKDWVFPQALAGLPRSGKMLEVDLLSYIDRLSRPGTYELLLHPGEGDKTTAFSYRSWGYCWEGEMQAACSRQVRVCLQENNVELVAYGSLD